MIKFIYLNANADAEKILNTVNHYLLLDATMDLEEFDNQLSTIIDDAFKKMQNTESIYKINSNITMQGGSRIKRLIKKIIRKMIGWYVNIYAESQIEFNAQLLGNMNEQMEIIRGLYLRNLMLSRQNEQLRSMIKAASNEEKVNEK